MYRCSNCGTTMIEPLARCPNCNVSLWGVKCTSCGFIGEKKVFIENNHRCPKCNARAELGNVCPKCGTGEGWDGVFCEACGHRNWLWIVLFFIIGSVWSYGAYQFIIAPIIRDPAKTLIFTSITTTFNTILGMLVFLILIFPGPTCLLGGILALVKRPKKRY